MNASNLVTLYEEFIQKGIDIWLDGGWGVDALLGEQTRQHSDVDIVVQEKDVSRIRDILESKGYKDLKKDDTRAWNFALVDKNGNEVDVHVINFDKDGNGIYGPAENGEFYPPYAFKGEGIVLELPIKCMSAEYQVQNHNTGYSLRDRDIKDISALCKKFGLPYPEEYPHSRK